MKKILTILFSLAVITIITGGGYAFYLYQSTEQTAEDVYEETNRESSEKREVKFDMEKSEPISILLLGIGDHPGDVGRSDSMVILTLNPKEESMYMFNIPRDTRTEIIGRGEEDKINHAYAFGGTEMAIDTVEHFLDIPIDYYIRIGMEGFADMVDVFGGVTVENDFAFEQTGEYYDEGEIHLDGERALHYSRMRKSDPEGDLGRNARQQQVLNELIREGTSLSNLTRVNEILDVVGENLRTDLSFKEMRVLSDNYRGVQHNINQFKINGEDKYVDNLYYYVVSEEERERVSQKVRQHLELDDQETVRTE